MRAGGTRARPARARGYARSGATCPPGGTRARGYALSGARVLGVRAIVSGDREPAFRAQRSSHLSRSARPRVGFFGGAGCPFNCETQPAPPKQLRAKAAEARAATCDPHEAQITLLRRSAWRRRHQSRGDAISLAAAPSVSRRRHQSRAGAISLRGDAISLAATPSVSRRRHQSRGDAISRAAAPSVSRRRHQSRGDGHQSRGDAISRGATPSSLRATHHSRGEASVARRRHQSRGGAISCTTSGANHLRRRAIERVPRGSAEPNP